MIFHLIGIMNMYFAIALFPTINFVSLGIAIGWAWFNIDRDKNKKNKD